MVEHANHYSWLGYRANGFGLNITFITLHPEYKKLGTYLMLGSRSVALYFVGEWQKKI